MIRPMTLSLALSPGLCFMQGCNDTPVSPMASASKENGQTRDQAEDNDIALFVSSGGTDNVLAFDGEDGSFESKFARNGGLIEPEGLAFGPDGNLYVSSRTDEVLRYDGETGEFIDVFASGHGLSNPPTVVRATNSNGFAISRPSSATGNCYGQDTGSGTPRCRSLSTELRRLR